MFEAQRYKAGFYLLFIFVKIESMNFIDIILGILILLALFKGLKNGLVVELASLVALVAGLFGAIHFSYVAGSYLAEKVSWEERYINLAAFFITFVVIVLVINLLAKFLTNIADAVALGLLNRLAGGVFGALKMAIFLGGMLIFVETTNATFRFIKEETLEQSALYGPVKAIGATVFKWVLKDNNNNQAE